MKVRKTKAKKAERIVLVEGGSKKFREAMLKELAKHTLRALDKKGSLK